MPPADLDERASDAQTTQKQPSPASGRPVADLEHPWLGLESFGEETRAYFFGRDAEISELHLRARGDPLLVLHGRSGLGKTSILLAGIIPKLRAYGRSPLLLRLRYSGSAQDVREQLVSAAFGLADERSGPVQQETQTSESLLWTRRLGEKLRLPLPEDLASRLWLRLHYLGEPPAITHLVLDQFEEVFTLDTLQPGAETRVRETLAILLQGAVPEPIGQLISEEDSFGDHFNADSVPIRVILALRSDYVYALNRWRRYLPALGQNSFELRALRGPAAFDAVFKPGELRCHYQGEVNEENKAETSLPPIISQETAQRIVRFVAQKGEEVPIEDIEAVPPILSLLCRELNERRFTEPAGTSEEPAEQVIFRENEADIQTIITAFYERCLAGRPEAVRVFIEEELVSYSGARLAQDEKSFLRVFVEGCEVPGAAHGQHADGFGDAIAARVCLEELVDQRLLSSIGRGENPSYELIHDQLAAVVERSRNSRKERLQKEEAERRADAARKAKEDAEARANMERELRREQERAHKLEAERAKEAEMRKLRQRKRRNIGLLLGLLTLIITASAVYWLVYIPWRQGQPWCYLRNLATGRVHELTGEFATIGRSTKDFYNKINLLPRPISRTHLIVLRNFVAFDVRSTYGTTVNANFLPYAHSKILEEGDIIVVAGIVPLKLQKPIYRLLLPEPPTEAPPPPEAVGMLIDGRAKAINYLRTGESFVSLDERQRLIVQDEKTETALLTIRIEANGQIRIGQDQSARIPLYVIWKETDYDFPEKPVQLGQKHTVVYNTLDRPKEVFLFRQNETDVPFQIVPIFPGLKLEPDEQSELFRASSSEGT
jgi:hypothetical protein